MTRYGKLMLGLGTLGSVIGALSLLGAGWQGVKRIGLMSPLGYEAKLTAGGALQLTTEAPGAPAEINPPGSSYDRLSFIYSQLPNNGLQINSDGKIHVTIDGLEGGGGGTWGSITGTLSNQTDLQSALNAKQATIAYTTEDVANKSTDVALGSSDTLYPSQLAVKTYADTKQASLGFTAENAANKSTDVALGASDTLYSSQKAVKTYVDTTIADALDAGYTAENVANKSTDVALGNSNTFYSSQLAVKTYVDTIADTKQATIAYTTEDVANKSTTVTLGTSDTLYPSQKAVKTYVDVTVADIIAGAGTGDITEVGSCTTGACFTGGVPAASLVFNNVTSGTVTLQTVAGALGTRTLSMPAETGTVCTTGSVCSGYQAAVTDGAADGATKGLVAFVAADMNCTAGICGIDYTNAQKATGSIPGLLTAADWTTFNAKQAAGSYATLTGIETLTNKRVTPKATSVATATSFACNVDNSNDCYMAMTGVAGTVTLAAPGGTPTEMQRVIYRLKCTNAQTYAFNAIFRFGTVIAAPVTCAAGKTDYIGAIYNSTDTKWDVVAVTQGY